MFDGKSIADWLTENVIIVLMIVIAAGVLAQAMTGNIRKAMTAVAITFLALLLIGMASHTDDIGGWLWGLIS